MASGNAGSTLKRKAVVGREKGPGGRRPVPSRALAIAVSKAFDAGMALPATVGDCVEHTCSQAELLERLPPSGLFALLEGPAEAQGLMVFDPMLLGAIIERQMTGGLAPEPPAPRRPTRTDAALSADLVDSILRAFAAEFAGWPETRWVAGYGYASYLEEPRPLTLMLEDAVYRLFSFSVDLGVGTTRQASGMLALLAEGRGPVVADPEVPGPPPADLTPEVWQTALEASVCAGEVGLEGVLHRFSLSIAAISALEPGQMIELPTRRIDRTDLVGLDGTAVASGRLGSSGGWRAIRVLRIGEGAEAGAVAAGPNAQDRTQDREAMPGAAADDGSGAGRETHGVGLPALTTAPLTPAQLPDLADLSDFPAMEPMSNLPDL